MVSAADILHAARSKGWMIATAESCTGGMVAVALTDIPGSSDVFERGFVTYTNTAKIEMLGVNRSALDKYGAVSEEVATQMAKGALSHSGADLAIAVTGIAGPGGSEFKPEGLVWFGLASPASVTSEQVNFGALGRGAVRRAARDHALGLLAMALGCKST